jgi:HD-like signal output (HDOD) protein
MASASEFRQLERSAVRVPHEECAAVVFEQWQLPDSLVEVARWHHAPLSAPSPHEWMATGAWPGAEPDC